jgi:hypothetical protein
MDVPIRKAEGAILHVHGNGVAGFLLGREVHLKFDMVLRLVKGPHLFQEPFKTFPVLRGYGEVKPTDSTGVTHILRGLHQVFLKRSPIPVGISMEGEQSLGEVGVVETARGKKILEDLPEPPLFKEDTDVEGSLGHDTFEGIEEGEALEIIDECQEILKALLSGLRPLGNLIPIHPGFMGMEPEGDLEHPGGCP